MLLFVGPLCVEGTVAYELLFVGPLCVEGTVAYESKAKTALHCRGQAAAQMLSLKHRNDKHSGTVV